MEPNEEGSNHLLQKAVLYIAPTLSVSGAQSQTEAQQSQILRIAISILPLQTLLTRIIEITTFANTTVSACQSTHQKCNTSNEFFEPRINDAFEQITRNRIGSPSNDSGLEIIQV